MVILADDCDWWWSWWWTDDDKILFDIDLPHDKTNKMTVGQAKTQISLGIRPVWSYFAVRSMGS